MAADETGKSGRLWRTIVWILRITVALQCVGNWGWLVKTGESPLLSWMIGPADVGGLGWSEATGLAVQSATGWLALLAGLCVLLRPCAAVTAPLLVLQSLIAVAMCRSGYGFVPQASWLSPDMAALFPLATQSARIVAPLGLLLLDPWPVQAPLSQRRLGMAMALMLGGTAITFFAHGIEAWQHHPRFIDLLITTDRRLLGAGLTQSQAVQILTLIGVVDFVVAVACLLRPFRGVLWWMVLWGGITSLSRITAFGWETAWHATLVRSPHWGLPLAVVLYWHLLRWRSAGRPEQPA